MKENRENRTIENIIYDAVERENEAGGKKTMSRERLEEIVQRDKKRSAKHMRRAAGLAAALIIVIAGAVIAFDTSLFDAGANKTGEEETVTEDGVVVEDEGWGSGDENVVVFENWEEALLAREDIEGLLVPEYMPEGYEFDNLQIENLEDGSLMCIFRFTAEQNEFIEIHEFIQAQDASAMTVVVDSSYQMETEKGVAYVAENDDDTKKATVQTDGGVIVDVISGLNDSEITAIINNLE